MICDEVQMDDQPTKDRCHQLLYGEGDSEESTHGCIWSAWDMVLSNTHGCISSAWDMVLSNPS